MTRRAVLPACLVIGAVLACINGLCQAFVATGQVDTGRRIAVRPPSGMQGQSTQTDLVGITCGMAASIAMAALASRASARTSRVMVKANSGSPSLIQVLEQKKLLSTLENLRLLSAAEKAGVKVDTLGLLTFAEKLNLLSLAENVLTNGSTPFLMLAGSGVLGFLAVSAASLSDGSFLQYFIAGALGAPALVLAVAALVILVVFGGARRTRDIDVSEKVVSYGPNGFNYSSEKRSASLLETVEQKRLLSFLEENRLLSLAGSLVNKPLTLTENLRLLSTLEQTGLLSQVESLAAQRYGGVPFGLGGLAILAAAVLAAYLLPTNGLLVALLLALPGLVLVVIGVAIGLVKPPVKNESFSNA
eukprot:symbB.v1.2.037413.t1/scaffold5518.1/size26226/2